MHPTAVLGALLLTVLLPKVPVLSAVDEWFRTRLQAMAAIPHEVRRIAAKLRRAPFRIENASARQALTAALVDKGFERADLLFDGGPTPEASWTKLSALMQRLDAWDADSHFTTFALTCPGELAALRRRYAEVIPKARKCFQLSRELAADTDRARISAALTAYREDLSEQLDGLLRLVYATISRAILLCELTQGQRARQLIALGFEVDPDPPQRLTLNHLMALFTAASVLFTVAFVTASSRAITPDLFVRAIMIAAIYCVAVWCAIYPKSRWSFARRDPEAGRPWASYLLSGAFAVVAGAILAFATKLLMLRDPALAWTRYGEASPWGFMTFTVTWVVAFMADTEPDRNPLAGAISIPLRWIEAMSLSSVMASVGWFVHTMLERTMSNLLARPSLPLVLVLTVIMGLVIGALVPSWYRHRPEARPSGPAPVPLAASVTAR